MTTVREVMAAVEELAPARYAFGFDRIGLQVGSLTDQVKGITVSLDPSLECIHSVKDQGHNLLISHHPVIWDPMKTLSFGTPAVELVRNGINFIASHTNWDCAPGGINDVLAEILNLSSISDFGETSGKNELKLVFYIPAGQEEKMVRLLSKAGAGRIGEYDGCAFLVPGTGTFTPGSKANPTIGTPGKTERVDEVRVEMRVRPDATDKVRQVLIENHPYEEPAFDFLVLDYTEGQPAGRIGDCSQMTLEQFGQEVDAKLDTHCMTWSAGKPVRRVAVVGGAAADHWDKALAAGADTFVTGEVPHHISILAPENGLNIVAAGHYATENPGMKRFSELLAELVNTKVSFFAPEAGQSGHPY